MKFLFRCFTASLTVALCVVTSACGQKGRLVMPPNPTPISTPYPVAQPKPANDAPADAPANEPISGPDKN